MEIETPQAKKSVVKPRKKLEQIPDTSSRIPDNSHLISEEKRKDQVPGTGNSPGKSPAPVPTSDKEVNSEKTVKENKQKETTPEKKVPEKPKDSQVLVFRYYIEACLEGKRFRDTSCLEGQSHFSPLVFTAFNL